MRRGGPRGGQQGQVPLCTNSTLGYRSPPPAEKAQAKPGGGAVCTFQGGGRGHGGQVKGRGLGQAFHLCLFQTHGDPNVVLTISFQGKGEGGRCS